MDIELEPMMNAGPLGKERRRCSSFSGARGRTNPLLRRRRVVCSVADATVTFSRASSSTSAAPRHADDDTSYLQLRRNISPEDLAARRVPVISRAYGSPTVLSAVDSRDLVCDGVLGIVWLLAGPYVVLVDESREVCTVPALPPPTPVDDTALLSDALRMRSVGVRCVHAVSFLPLLRPEDRPLLSPALVQEEERMLGMLRDLLTPARSRQRFYFSSVPGAFDITSSYQRQASLPSLASGGAVQDETGYDNDIGDSESRRCRHSHGEARRPWARLNTRFWWNAHLVDAFKVDARTFQWILPCVNGHVASVGNDMPARLVLLCRRSRYHQGHRFFCRGLDRRGEPANEVECEQVVVRGDVASSFVQIRGSVPLAWSQPPTGRAVPRVALSTPAAGLGVHWTDHSVLFRQHMRNLESRYGGDIAVVNLVSGTKRGDKLDLSNVSAARKDQIRLGQAYERLFGQDWHARRTKATPPGAAAKNYERKSDGIRGSGGGSGGVDFVWFDFHHECRGGQYDRLSRLAARVEPWMQRQGFFAYNWTTGKATRWQAGAIRTNCLDTLDRTNAAQALFAGMSLVQQLGVTSESARAKLAGMPKNLSRNGFLTFAVGARFERAFRELWVQNGDRQSMCYAGSPALKRELVRMGTYSKGAKMSDKLVSLRRFYENNFAQGSRQDTVDLFFGAAPRGLTDRSADLAALRAARHRGTVARRWAVAALGPCLWVLLWWIMPEALHRGESAPPILAENAASALAATSCARPLSMAAFLLPKWVAVEKVTCLWSLLLLVGFFILLKGWAHSMVQTLVDRPLLMRGHIKRDP